jgi:hypothetical protein
VTKDGIDELVRIASPALSDGTPRLRTELAALAGYLAPQLLKLFWARNGFFAFESALHVFPATPGPTATDLLEWNSETLWKSKFGALANGALFFAEDAFGAQFCISEGAVYRFNPETGEREAIAASIDEWAALILRDSRNQTGWPVAHEWQQRFGPMPTNTRLVPKVPFVLGGEFTISNLDARDRVEAMRFYASVATQIQNQVRLRVVE